MFHRHKHSSLFVLNASDEEKSFIELAPSVTDQGSLLKGKAQYGGHPCTIQFTSAPCHIIYLLQKTSYLNEEVNCTEPFLSASIPCTDDKKMTKSLEFFFQKFRFIFRHFPPFSPAAGRRQAGFEPQISRAVAVCSTTVPLESLIKLHFKVIYNFLVFLASQNI